MFAIGINSVSWIVATIHKQIIITKIIIRINPPPNLRIVISALEVIESGFAVVDVAAVAEGVILAEGRFHGAGDGKGLAPGVIGIADHLIAGAVHKSDHVTLKVQDEVIDFAVVADRHRPSFSVIGQIQNQALIFDLRKLTALVIHIIVFRGAGVPACPQTVSIVAEAPGGGAGGHGCQLPSLRPCIGPCAVAEGIADGIVGDGGAIVGGQQITPDGTAIAIGDCIRRRSQGSGGISFVRVTVEGRLIPPTVFSLGNQKAYLKIMPLQAENVTAMYQPASIAFGGQKAVC